MRNMDSAESVPTDRRFRDQLQVMCAGSKKSVLLQKEDYFNLIEELKEAEKTKTKAFWNVTVLEQTDASQTNVNALKRNWNVIVAAIPACHVKINSKCKAFVTVWNMKTLLHARSILVLSMCVMCITIRPGTFIIIFCRYGWLLCSLNISLNRSLY